MERTISLEKRTGWNLRHIFDGSFEDKLDGRGAWKRSSPSTLGPNKHRPHRVEEDKITSTSTAFRQSSF